MIRTKRILKKLEEIGKANGMRFKYLGNKNYAFIRPYTEERLSDVFHLGTWMDLYEQNLIEVIED